jgi:lipopolysaccharide transport system ATP-binding protein
LRDALVARFRRNGKSQEEEILWALKDVSFEVKRGEVVGVIGRNGAGKSTLLKILSRITEPTTGHAEIHGRVGSLLEVGTGFHPELTGRENIYLNGAILGMKRAEIARKFDEIVAFSEIEKFLDTPVKRYSSGMYVRLAFAVAAHLEPEILLVDEVLAVGDASFQKKCLGKMGDVAQEGRTVLFVSHNMGAIMQLCYSAILFSYGRLVLFSDSEKTVSSYLLGHNQKEADVKLDPTLNPSKPVILTRCRLVDPSESPVTILGVKDGFSIDLEVLAREEVSDVEISLRVHDRSGNALFTTNVSSYTKQLQTLSVGLHSYSVEIPACFLAPGSYYVHVGIHRPNITVFDIHDHILAFTVEESGSDMWQYFQKAYGSILVQFPWQHRML